MSDFSNCKVEHIETPALLLDLDLLEENIRIMADFFKDRKASLRPHFKTCKCPTVAHLQLKAGAKGITCAKVGEAEVLLQSRGRDRCAKGMITYINELADSQTRSTAMEITLKLKERGSR